MHITLALLAALLPTYVFSAPTPLPERRQTNSTLKSETTPWKLTNIIVFEAAANATKQSYISFDLADTNPSLKFQTHCQHSVAPGLIPTDDVGYYNRCKNSTASFRYNAEQVEIRRYYQDSK